MTDPFDLTGRVAVITGSSKGIGKAIAQALARHGAKVVISSRKEKACEAAAAEIRDGGGEAIVIPCHIGHKDQLRALVDQTLDAWGRIDCLVCNAAANPVYGPMHEMSDEAWQRVMDTNVKSNFWLCNMAAPVMAENGDGGAIIVISSISGLKGSRNIGLYAISKAADVQFVRNLAVEWGDAKIRANCITPGLIRTDFARALWDNPDILKKVESLTPLGRIGEPEDVAGMAVLLAGDAGRFITGQSFIIDGGVSVADQL